MQDWLLLIFGGNNWTAS